jgi:hypothetical protein
LKLLKMNPSTIDFRTLPTNIPSLCIPRVFPNISEQRILNIFKELNLGDIKRIDIVKKTTEKGEHFNRVFVHFAGWYANENADIARERLLNGKEIKIIYDEPWFWKVSAYREPNKSQPQKPTRPVHVPKRASLQFDSEEESPIPRQKPYPVPVPHTQDARQQRPDARQQRPDARQQRPDARQQRPDARQQRPDARPRQAAKQLVPRSPSNSPPRERPQQEPYQAVLPVKKRTISKKPIAKGTTGEEEVKPVAVAQAVAVEPLEEGEI